jgi:hypothetical protein
LSGFVEAFVARLEHELVDLGSGGRLRRRRCSATSNLVSESETIATSMSFGGGPSTPLTRSAHEPKMNTEI